MAPETPVGNPFVNGLVGRRVEMLRREKIGGQTGAHVYVCERKDRCTSAFVRLGWYQVEHYQRTTHNEIPVDLPSHTWKAIKI